MQRARYWKAILASCLISMFLVNGCGDQHPKAPLGSHPEASESATSLGKKRNGPGINTSPATESRVERYDLLNLALMQAENLSISQLVKANTGGTLYFGEFKFYVPPGSLAQDTVIKIKMTSDKYIQMDFGPDGTQFNPPAVMTVTYVTANLKGKTPSNLSVSWFDTATSQWVNIGGTVDESTLTVSVPISHFTEYSLSMR